MNKQDIIIKEIVLSYEKQYPDRIDNFEKLMGFPYKRYKKCRNRNLNKLARYYESLINDMDFLISLVSKCQKESKEEKNE